MAHLLFLVVAVSWSDLDLMHEHLSRLVRMQAAVSDSSWLMVDAWECSQSEWTRTALVLRELAHRLPAIEGRRVKVMMVRLCAPRLSLARSLFLCLSLSLSLSLFPRSPRPPHVSILTVFNHNDWCPGVWWRPAGVVHGYQGGRRAMWLPEDQKIILAENEWPVLSGRA